MRVQVSGSLYKNESVICPLLELILLLYECRIVLEFDDVGATRHNTASPCRRIPSDLWFVIYPSVLLLVRPLAAAMLNKLARSLQSVYLSKCVSCVVRF